jgi:hypothetical protein
MDAAVELTRMYLQRVLIKTSHTRVSKYLQRLSTVSYQRAEEGV